MSLTERHLVPKHILDAHVHIMTPERVKGGIRWIRKVAPDYERLDLNVTQQQLLDHLQEQGVEAFFNFFYPLNPDESGGINRWQKDLEDSCPGCISFASLHPGDINKERLIKEALDDLGLAGFKFHPYVQKFSLLDPRLEMVFHELQARECPVFIHTGFADFYRCPSMVEDTTALLKKFPRLKLVVSHMLYPEFAITDWPSFLEHYPNLYLDATNTLTVCESEGNDWQELRNLLASHSERILFGSDFPMGMAYPVQKLYRAAAVICPDQECLDNIMWRTALCLLNQGTLGW